MQNHGCRTLAILTVLLVAAAFVTTPAHLAKRRPSPSKEDRKVPNGARAEKSSDGKIVITSVSKIILIDRASKAVLWESDGLRGAHSVAALPGGEFLVGEGKSIARVDSEGKAVSRSSASFQMTTDAKPLDNGKMLVSDGPAGTVVEMNWAGNITWSVSKLHHPSEAVRLANGNTVVADGTANLKEFDAAGKLVQATRLRQWAAAVQRLSDGSTLVGEREFVELLDISGHAIWSRPMTGRVTGVGQLPSGEYLLCQPDAKRVVIMDVNGKVIWEVTGLSFPWHAIYVP